MNITLDDNTRTGIILLAGNVISAVVLFGVVDWDVEQVAILNSAVNTAVTLGFRMFRVGQQAVPAKEETSA